MRPQPKVYSNKLSIRCSRQTLARTENTLLAKMLRCLLNGFKQSRSQTKHLCVDICVCATLESSCSPDDSAFAVVSGRRGNGEVMDALFDSDSDGEAYDFEEDDI